MDEKCIGVRSANSINDETYSHLSKEQRATLGDFAVLQQQGIKEPFSSRPMTSQPKSMSLLENEEEEECSQQEFVEVIDDETSTTSGVLETFEISSSNSLTTSSDEPSAIAIAVEDSSTTDTIKQVVHEDSDVCESIMNARTSFYNNSEAEVYVINDEDEDEDIVANDVENLNALNRSRSERHNSSSNSSSNMNISHLSEDSAELIKKGIIIAADGTKIFLETPIVEEQMHHHLQMGNSDIDHSEYAEKSGIPKRLSDEFMLEEIGCQASSSEQQELTTSTNYAQIKPCDFSMADGSRDVVSLESTYNQIKGTKSEQNDPSLSSVGAELSHDRIMSVRLKKMSITTNTNCRNLQDSNLLTTNEVQALPSRSCSQMPQVPQVPTIADIESMDIIERRDFETEQRLTGASILKTSSIMNNKNMLNLSLIKSCAEQQQQRNASSQGLASSSSTCNDDWPSSSNSRIVSSDSKCTYKDMCSTPTSSRKFNHRLTKSTAKINLCPALSHQSQQQHPISSLLDHHQKLLQNKNSDDGACSHSLALEPAFGSYLNSSTSASLLSGASTSTSTSTSGAARTEVYNTNSNENVASGNASNNSCQQDDSQLVSQSSTSTSASGFLTAEGSSGCSRTSAINNLSNNGIAFDDAQPSTSSARCQYALLKNLRQVNVSAQTNERFLSRPRLGNANVCVNVVNISGRGRADNSNCDGLDEVIFIGSGEGAGEHGDFSADDSWADCEEENIGSDLEEICTCQNGGNSDSSHGGSNTSLNETIDMDATVDNCVVDDAASVDFSVTASSVPPVNGSNALQIQRKRKYNDGRFQDSDYSLAANSNSGSLSGDNNSRKRVAYDYASTPRSSQLTSFNFSITAPTTPTPSIVCVSTAVITGSPISRRTPRSSGIPTRDNPSPELLMWLAQFQRWSHAERLVAVDRLIDLCDPSQVRHMMKVIEPQFQRDFISLLPKELALSVLSYLEPKDLLRAAQTCRSWRFLCDDNLLWKEKCRKAQILTEPRSDRPKRGRAGNMPLIASPWKAAYMRQHIIEMNWRSRPVRDPKVLKGHDDHVITCLQFSGNRIVSGSDDNTLKVWSAITGRCLRTLVGHTGGVWSSQMAGNVIISGSTDRTLKVWDMETGICIHTLQGHTSTVRCMHLHANKVVSGSRDATLRVWDIDLGTCLHVLVGHLAAVRCVQYDGKLIVSGAYDYMVKIWHPERQECLHTLQGHTNRVYSLQFDGVHVVSGSLDTSIRVWDVETGNCKHTLMGHQSLTSGMELRQNILVSGNADSTVKVWDITTGQCLQTLSGPNKHQSAVTCLQFNSRFVVTSSDDGTVKLWDVNTGDFIRNLVALDSGGSGGVVWRIRANDTKLICAVGSRNGTEETKLMVLDFDVEGACVKCS